MFNPDRVAGTLESAGHDMIGRGDLEAGERLACSMVFAIADALRTDSIPIDLAPAITWLDGALTESLDDVIEECGR